MNEIGPIKKKNVFKKSLAIELMKRQNKLLYSMLNWNKPKHRVYVFEKNFKLIADMLQPTSSH
ncbi:hypothetical protein [Lysinibacillus xylanilyticus]|uniref:hypothetical protein n=1 Tax=Lysinibacillus xylanilyticus TaxID=582475 RepID=UPI003D032B5C